MKTKKQRDLPPWKSAAEHVIDWTIPGKSIFYRKKPLAPDTIRRIKHGLKTFGLAPYFASYHGGPDASRRLSLLWQPLPTLDCSNRFALIRSFISKGFGGNYRGPGESIFSPLPTITTRDHNFLVRPALCVMRGQSNSVSVDNPLSTVSCGFHHQLTRPIIIRSDFTKAAPQIRTLGFPISSVVTKACHHFVEPFLVDYHGLSADRGQGGVSIFDPLFTVTASGRHHGLIIPFFIRSDYTHAGERRVESIFDPIATLTTKPRHYLSEAFVIETDYRHQVHKGKQSIFDPLATITTTPRHALVDPFIVEYYGTSLSQSLWVPLPTVTTKDRHGLVDLVIQHEGSVESLPVVRTPEDIDAHDFARPFCIEVDGARYLVDITLRMLAPRELARAMGFPESFRFEKLDGTPLTKQDAVKMIGNACPVNTVRELVKAVIKPRAEDFGIEND